MKTIPSRAPALEASQQRRGAFTLTELLVIIAIVTILFSLMLPALASAGGRSRVAQCGSNLKQYTMVFELFAMDNNNNLPQNVGGVGSWPWDYGVNNFNHLIPYGVTREMVYCPANPGQNIDINWNYFTLHVTGYAMTFPGPGLLYTNLNSSVIPKTIQFGPLLMLPKSSKRVLVADSVISAHGQTNVTQTASYDFSTNLTGGAVLPNGVPVHFRTSHLLGPLPAGGNLGMLDGHVEWRKFKDMVSRMDPSGPATTLTWWW